MRSLLFILGIFSGLLPACKSRQEVSRDAAPAAAGGAGEPVGTGTKAPCAELAERMCAHFGKSSDLCAFSERQTQRFRTEFCQTKLDKFPESVAELSKYKVARGLIAQSVQKSSNIDAPTLGPRDAPVVLTVFCDFEASDCGRLSPLHNFITNLHSGQVRLVFRQFPLTKNTGARLAAQASLAASAQGKFWEYHDVLFSNPQDHSRAALERYAKAVGLNLAAFKKALDDHAYLTDVNADKELGQSLFISELPAVFANGSAVSAPNAEPELKQILDEAIARGRP